MTADADADRISSARVVELMQACARVFADHSTEEVLAALAILTALTCEDCPGEVADGDSTAQRWADFERMAHGVSPAGRLAILRLLVGLEDTVP